MDAFVVQRLDGHDEIKATADVPAPLICGRFHLCATRKEKARNFSRAFLILY
jgi:hypothetical protein